MTVTLQKLHETGRIAEAPAGTTRRSATIISAGWGSSGYYSREMLERDGPAIFGAGTHMYLNHPTEQEEFERPERDVKDLAARIDTTPRMIGNDLIAEIVIFPIWQPVIDSLAEDIGLSIRAFGEMEHGEAEGREGPIITRLTEGRSVDFVTQAGRGGKIGALIESVRVKERLSSDVRRDLDSAGGARFGSEDTNVYVDDFDIDENWAVYCVYKKGVADTYLRVGYQQGETGGIVLSNEVTQVSRKVTYVPTEDVEEKEQLVEQNEQRIKELEGKVATLETKVTEATEALTTETTKRERAEDALMRVGSEKIVREAVEKVEDLPEGRAVERAVKSAMSSKLPVDEDGKLDTERLQDRAKKAAEEERDYLAESVGTGRVKDLGGGNGGGGGGAEETQKKLIESFKNLGMSDDAAEIAAGGR